MYVDAVDENRMVGMVVMEYVALAIMMIIFMAPLLVAIFI